MKLAEKGPTVGINISKLFDSSYGDFKPLVNSFTFISACTAKVKLLALQISISQY